MCAALTGVFAGKPLRFTTKVADAAVTLPAASFVKSNVIVTLPLPLDSAFVTGGTSFAGLRSAVKVGFTADAVVGDDELQPAANSATAIASAGQYLIPSLLRRISASD